MRLSAIGLIATLALGLPAEAQQVGKVSRSGNAEALNTSPLSGEGQPRYEHRRTKEVVDLVNEAVSLIEKDGERAFPLLKKEGSKWFKGDLYLFVYDTNGVNVAHPLRPRLEGQNLIDLKDINGKPIIRMMLDRVSSPGKRSGWVHYMWFRPNEIFPGWKSSFVRLARSPSGQEYLVGGGLFDMQMEKAFIVEMVDAAAQLLEKEGKVPLNQFRDKSGPFIFVDSYIFILDEKGNAIIDPALPSLRGRNLMDYKDAVGRYVTREMFEKLVHPGDSAWIYYMLRRPGKVRPIKKLAYVRKVQVGSEMLIVGAGFAPLPPIWIR